MKTLLITGGAGFIGSNFINYFLNKYQSFSVINLDALTYAADLSILHSLATHPRYKFIHGNICNKQLLEDLFAREKINSIIHFAAESHVDNSIAKPSQFIETNINGTFNLLEIARKYWSKEQHLMENRFHHISTDEVYGTLGTEGYFIESSPYAPNSPYSASKAASDMLVRSYFHTYKLNTVITNCSNNYGPHQHLEKLIPKIITNAVRGQEIPIYGDGKNIRDWLFVEDHCEAIDLVFFKGKAGEVYNVGGEGELENVQVVKEICSILDEIKPKSSKYFELMKFVDDRPGHDRRYAIDSSKIQRELGWTARTSFHEGIKKTIKWYLEKYNDQDK